MYKTVSKVRTGRTKPLSGAVCMDVIATVRDDRTRSATRLALSQLHSSLQSLGGEAERSLVRRQLT